MTLNKAEGIAACLAPTVAIFVAGLLLAIVTFDGHAFFFAMIVWVVSLPWQLLAIPMFLYLYVQLKKQTMPRALATLFATLTSTLFQAAGTFILTDNTMLFAVLILGPLSGLSFILLSYPRPAKSHAEA